MTQSRALGTVKLKPVSAKPHSITRALERGYDIKYNNQVQYYQGNKRGSSTIKYIILEYENNMKITAV